ncbi:hypothetical protein LN458_15780 [Xanthomonas arboricola]|uniref:hypothetical protein n=1 Tax=Xanthomonas arboricola TaxID=56448 RepID=UPI000A8A4E99|nr:hypothetical protein [Xanthomonas arboricola]MCC8475445.1 hypothetical protein [Xanthomonas arboricola]
MIVQLRKYGCNALLHTVEARTRKQSCGFAAIRQASGWICRSSSATVIRPILFVAMVGWKTSARQRATMKMHRFIP